MPPFYPYHIHLGMKAEDTPQKCRGLSGELYDFLSAAGASALHLAYANGIGREGRDPYSRAESSTN